MGFENIVRPSVFPNIRPAPAQPVAPPDAPDKGVAVFSGGGGKLVALPFTSSMSFSRSKQHQHEVERTVDVKRVYQKEEDGTINKTNYLEMEVARKMKAVDPNGIYTWINYETKENPDNVEDIEKNKTIKYEGATYCTDPDPRIIDTTTGAPIAMRLDDPRTLQALLRVLQRRRK
jgi:hypothetical protein